MLRCIFTCFFALFYSLLMSQQSKKFVLVDVQTEQEFSRKDSLSAVKFLDSLAENNYYFTKIEKVENLENSIKIYFDKGINFNKANVKLSREISEEIQKPQEFFVQNLDSLRQEINKKYTEKGFAFNRVKTQYLGMENQIPIVEISIKKGEVRRINGFVLRGYQRVPKRFIRNIEQEFLEKNYNETSLNRIYQRLKNHAFVTLEKPPQTLFTKDSTQIFLFLQKKKANVFDGIIGFGNDASDKFAFNGTLNLMFQNIFNGFESLHLYWQRGADKGQNFDLKLRVPYVFKSNIGADIQLNIYRQDTNFANVKAQPSVFYNLSERQKLGLRGNVEVSSVLDKNITLAKDFSRNGLGFWYEYSQPSDIEIFINDLKVRAEADYLTTHYDEENVKYSSTRFFGYGEKNFHIIGNHYLNMKAETAIFNTKSEISVNELFRIGGWNSLRGFNENSILANFYAYGSAEYRYLVGQSAFFDIFGQYAQIKNQSANISSKLYSVGLGFNFILPIGQMSFQISNGSQIGEPFKFRETKIHWGIVSRF